MHGLERIKDAREGGVGDLVAPRSAIKNKIGAPQRLPLWAIRTLDRPHPEIWQWPPSPLVPIRDTRVRSAGSMVRTVLTSVAARDCLAPAYLPRRRWSPRGPARPSFWLASPR